MISPRPWLYRLGALGIAALFVVVLSGDLRAQPAPEATPAAAPDESNPDELLKSYQQMREELRTTRLAMTKNQAEAEARARAQVAAISDQLGSIKSFLAAEQERHQGDMQRWKAERERQELEMQHANGERERQRIESERSNQRMLFIASSFGCVSLLAMILLPLFQWRAIHRITEMENKRAQLPAPSPQGLLPGGTEAQWGKTVTSSNQSLMSAIERMERRVMDLEHTASEPLTSTPSASDQPKAVASHEAEKPRRVR